MLVLAPLLLVTALAVPRPNPVYEAEPLMQFVNKTDYGKLYHIKKDNISVNVLHLWGRPQQLGYAQGLLLGSVINNFLLDLDKFFESLAGQIPLEGLPEWLQKEIQNAVGKDIPPAVHAALAYVYDREYPYLLMAKARPLEEADGMGLGVCESGAVPNCDATEMATKIKHANMLPELLKMSCSMMGAWGKATPTGKLTQLRTLDFGPGPFATYSTFIVYHPEDGLNWMNIGFTSFFGGVTGVNEHLSLSEKYWHGQPGAYEGLPVTGAIREVLQFSSTKEEAHTNLASLKRTWSVFLGLGDDASQQFRVNTFRKENVLPYNYNNITDITSFAPVEDVVFLDKHYQPSHDKTMPGLVQTFYGNITALNVVQNFPRLEMSGDVHAAVYDHSEKKTYIAVGVVNAKGEYGPNNEGYACYQPFLKFDEAKLWNEPKP